VTIAYLNGQFLPLAEARISPLDRGFLFADGVYEVIPVYAGQPFRLAEHLRRLDYSLDAIALPSPHTHAQWEQICSELIQRNTAQHLSIYLQITRGVPIKREHAFPTATTAPTVFAMVHPMAIPESDQPSTATGIKAITAKDLRWKRCDIKSIGLLPNLLMSQLAASQGAAEAILINEGFAMEGASSNLFIVKDGMVITPPKSHKILGGVTRNVIIELCLANNVAVREENIPLSLLQEADEIWATSSTRAILPVVMLDDKPVGDGAPGPVWLKMAHHYTHFKRRLCGLE